MTESLSTPADWAEVDRRDRAEGRVVKPALILAAVLAVVAGLLALIDTHADLIAATADGVHDYGDPT